MALDRIQKILAQAGLASRRKAEELITEGVVTVNGKIAKLGDKADLSKDSIKVRGKLLQGVESHLYLAFHKPKGVISTMIDPEGRPTLADYLTKVRARLFTVGRLDFNSDGLILLTNDGDFAEKLQKRSDIPRVYTVKVKGHPTSDMITRLERGMRVGPKFMKPHSVRVLQTLDKKARVQVVVMDSANFDLKDYFEKKGLLVERTTRSAIGQITLHGIEPGHYKQLKKSQVQALLDHPKLALIALESEAKAAEPGLRAAERRTERLESRRRPDRKLPIKRG